MEQSPHYPLAAVNPAQDHVGPCGFPASAPNQLTVVWMGMIPLKGSKASNNQKALSTYKMNKLVGKVLSYSCLPVVKITSNV